MKEKISNKIYSKYSRDLISKKMLLLGIDEYDKTINFLNLRLITSIIIFFVIIYLVDWGYVLGPITVLLYYFFLPKIVLDKKIIERRHKLEYEALYFFEILSLSLESGNNLYNAIKVTSDNIDSELSVEFRKMLEDIKYGKSFDEALLSLKERIPSDTINNIILNIRESNLFGNNILDTLVNQLDYLREVKVLEAKAQISKIPLKISVVSVILFIPIILLLILGPVLINYLS